MIVRRLVTIPIVLIGVTLVTFALVHALPGDAALVQAGTSRGASPESLAAMRKAYDLDRPLPAQYAAWLARSARLDFGDSLVDGRAVRDKIAEALPTSLALALLAVALAFGVAVPLGAALGWIDGRGQAPRHSLGAGTSPRFARLADRRSWARVSSAALYGIYALPVAAVALLVLRAGAPWGARTVVGMLPAAAVLALAETVKLARYQRGALLDALAADYVTTARAKGLGPAGVVAHALRNALLPTITLVGSELPALLSAAVVVEEVFGLHGIGRMAFDAVLTRDVPLLLGITTVGALVTLGAVLAADLAYGLADPRLRGRAS
ncbi:MAG TPA: ABC transporter permease [Polyangia bacterium]|jgi:peptide/nickel transport system permease protein